MALRKGTPCILLPRFIRNMLTSTRSSHINEVLSGSTRIYRIALLSGMEAYSWHASCTGCAVPPYEDTALSSKYHEHCMFPKPEAIRLLDHVVCKPPLRVFLGRVRQNLTMRKHASETPRSRSCTQAFQGHQPRTLLGSVKDLFKITII